MTPLIGVWPPTLNPPIRLGLFFGSAKIKKLGIQPNFEHYGIPQAQNNIVWFALRQFLLPNQAPVWGRRRDVWSLTLRICVSQEHWQRNQVRCCADLFVDATQSSWDKLRKWIFPNAAHKRGLSNTNKASAPHMPRVNRLPWMLHLLFLFPY